LGVHSEGDRRLPGNALLNREQDLEKPPHGNVKKQDLTPGLGKVLPESGKGLSPILGNAFNSCRSGKLQARITA